MCEFCNFGTELCNLKASIDLTFDTWQLSHKVKNRKSMNLFKILPVAAVLLVGLMSGCNKDRDSNLYSGMNAGDKSSVNQLKSGALPLATVNLGVAGEFEILTKTGVTDVFKSAVTGDVGSSPITGAAILLDCTEVTGVIYSVDAAGPACKVTNATRLTTAVSNMEAAYTDAAGRPNPDFLDLGAGNIGGLTLTPGLYKWSTGLIIPTDITISGGVNDVFILQVAGGLNVSSTVKITLAGGVQAKNIFWATAGAVSIGTGSHFEGNILGQTSISLLTGASINGKLLAQTAVSLQMNTVGLTVVDVPVVILPTVMFTSPLNNATAVAYDKAVTVTFSEEMNALSINASTFTLKQDAAIVSGVVTYTGTTATFSPVSALAPGKIYTATVTTGANSLTGNALVSDNTFSFTTLEAPVVIMPVLNSTDPLNNATGVLSNKVVALNFNVVMDPLTINASTVTLMQGANAISGTVACSGTTATFTPSSVLVEGMIYTASVSTGVKDLAGNALAASSNFSFTTVAPVSVSNLATVNLGVAGNFAILSKTGVTDVFKSTVTGDIGASPITGGAILISCAEVAGTVYSVDVNTVLPCAITSPVMLTTAVSNMEAAYTDAAGRSNPDFTEFGAGNIGGKTLTPGLYKWSSAVTIPANVTISGGPNDIWIFQVAGTLSMSSAMNITLAGGAQAKNIFWVVAGAVTVGTTSHFEGNILGQTAINMLTGSSINGSLFAQTAVNLQMSTVTKP
jgi:hypothetical protein